MLQVSSSCLLKVVLSLPPCGTASCVWLDPPLPANPSSDGRSPKRLALTLFSTRRSRRGRTRCRRLLSSPDQSHGGTKPRRVTQYASIDGLHLFLALQ
ncbi:hypothetical protein AAT19DRAFT_9140 [Rhodotorula toruloides]|uniref:Secreted protein n=1 Tax=Rhodotorula toruloides TaxID=5286 RepID=A0A2T0AJA6_RHOTO|nr:hypothetical protein AAT19DRAFT_9140 [Rhodotorula toruloides]